MAKGSKPSSVKMPSPAQMAKDDRMYRAKSMVRDAMEQTPRFKTACKAAEREMMKAESAVKSALKKK